MSFSSIGKAAQDLHSKGYPYDNLWKVEFNTRSVDGVNFVYAAQRNHSDEVSASVNAKYTCKEHGLTIEGDAKSGNKYKVSTSLDNKLYEGLNLKYTHESGNKNTVSAAYKNTWGGAEVKAVVPNDTRKSELEASTVIVKDKATFGVRNIFSIGDQPSFRSAEAAVQYKNLDYTATAKAHFAGGSDYVVGATYFQTLTARSMNIASCVCYTPKSADSIKLSVATEKLRTDGSTVRAKLDSAGKAGLAYSTVVGDRTKLTFATEFDALKLGKEGSNRYGVHVVFND